MKRVAAFDQGADRGAFQADDQVTFPVAGNGSIVGLGGRSLIITSAVTCAHACAVEHVRAAPAAHGRCAGTRPVHA